MPLGRILQEVSPQQAFSTHTDVHTDLNTSRFERVPLGGVYTGQVVSTGSSSNSDLGQGVHER
jgi:hypothetical protein